MSQGPIKSPPPLLSLPHGTPLSLSSSFSLSLSLKCHLHFSVHILRLQLPVDGLIFLALATTSTAHGACCGLKQLMMRPVCVPECVCVCGESTKLCMTLFWADTVPHPLFV